MVGEIHIVFYQTPNVQNSLRAANATAAGFIEA